MHEHQLTGLPSHHVVHSPASIEHFTRQSSLATSMFQASRARTESDGPPASQRGRCVHGDEGVTASRLAGGAERRLVGAPARLALELGAI